MMCLVCYSNGPEGVVFCLSTSEHQNIEEKYSAHSFTVRYSYFLIHQVWRNSSNLDYLIHRHNKLHRDIK